MHDKHNATGVAGAIPKVVADLREQLGLSLEQLGDLARLDRTTLGLVERGKRGLTLKSAESVALALGMSLSQLIVLAEVQARSCSDTTVETSSPREVPVAARGDDSLLVNKCEMGYESIKSAIEDAYATFDVLDRELLVRGAQPMAILVELANLSSMLGNLLGAGLAAASGGRFQRNAPHSFPDLVPKAEGRLEGIELKTALETNMPKGHLAKPGMYITFRYVLGNQDGLFERGRENRGTTIWIWEVRAGELKEDDFVESNTKGDSGKTAVIKAKSLRGMSCVVLDKRFNPYARDWDRQ